MTTALKPILSIRDIRWGASKLTPTLKTLSIILSILLTAVMFYVTYTTSVVIHSVAGKIIASLLVGCVTCIGSYAISRMIMGEIRSLFLSSRKEYLKELDIHNNDMMYIIGIVINAKNNEQGFQLINGKFDELKKTYPTAFDNSVCEPGNIHGSLLNNYFSAVSKLLEVSLKLKIKPEGQEIATQVDEVTRNVESSIDCDMNEIFDLSELYIKVSRFKIDLAKQLTQRKALASEILDFKLA